MQVGYPFNTMMGIPTYGSRTLGEHGEEQAQ